MHPSLGAIGVLLVAFIHLNSHLVEAEEGVTEAVTETVTKAVREGCCRKEMKAFYDANPKDPKFQEAILEPNATTCSIAQEVLNCFVNCTQVNVDNETVKRLIFGYTDYYCKEQKPIQEAIQCYKDAENQALTNATNECKDLLNDADKSETELKTNKQPEAVAKFCVSQGKAQECMKKDINVMKCQGIAGLYFFLQQQIGSLKLMLNTTDDKTLNACASYERILVNAETAAKKKEPKKSRMCCANQLEQFNPNPITDAAFQESIFHFGKMECMASNATLACFEKCLTEEPENEYAKSMSSVFVYLVNYCDKKEVFNKANHCFQTVDKNHLCANETKHAKESFEKMPGKNDVGTLQTACGNMDAEIKCISDEEKSTGTNCSKEIYHYYEYLVQIKIAMIHAIHASQGLPLDANVGNGCQDFLGDLKHLLNDEPIFTHAQGTSSTVPTESGSTTTPGQYEPSDGSTSPGDKSTTTTDPSATTSTSKSESTSPGTTSTTTVVPGHSQPINGTEHTNNPSGASEPSPGTDSTTGKNSADHMVYSRLLMGVIGVTSAVYLLF